MKSTTRCFEFSGNELVRVCLGLEYRHQRLSQLLSREDTDITQALDLVLQTLIQIDRYDFRNKFIRFHRVAKRYLQTLSDHPQVDKALLREHIARYSSFEADLYQQAQLLPDVIIKNPFLNFLKKQSTKSDFVAIDTQCSYFKGWMHKDYAHCITDLRAYNNALAWLWSNTHAVLSLLRENIASMKVHTEEGYHQYEHANSAQQIYLVRVLLDRDDIVPLVSVDHRRLLSKFNYLYTSYHPGQERSLYLKKVQFRLQVGAM